MGTSVPFAHDLSCRHTCSEQALFDLSISANLISFNAVISSCEREGRWREALHLLNEAGFGWGSGDRTSISDETSTNSGV